MQTVYIRMETLLCAGIRTGRCGRLSVTTIWEKSPCGKAHVLKTQRKNSLYHSSLRWEEPGMPFMVLPIRMDLAREVKYGLTACGLIRRTVDSIVISTMKQPGEQRIHLIRPMG